LIWVDQAFVKITWKQKSEVYRGTGHEGPEGEYRCSSTLSLTSALGGGGWSTSRFGFNIPEKETRYPVSFIKLKVKVHFAPEQATKAQRGSRGIAILFL